jgi:hypothetical protein
MENFQEAVYSITKGHFKLFLTQKRERERERGKNSTVFLQYPVA